MEFSESQLDFVLGVKSDPDKERYVLDYLGAKDRLEDCWYEIDPWDFIDDGTGRFNEESWKQAAIDQNNYVASLKEERDTSTEQLRLLGIKTTDIDAMGLSFDRYMQIIWSGVLNDMKTNTINHTNTNGSGDESLRKLPLLMIHDTEFYVDIAKLQFRQADNQANVIHFKDVQDNGDHTAIVYDPKTKNAFHGTQAEMKAREDVLLIKLPAKEDLDFDYVMQQLVKKREQIAQQSKESIQSKPTQEEKNRKTGKGQGL